MNLHIKKILVPTDFSRISLDVLKYAGYIARKFNSEITVLHVMELYEHNSELGQIMDYPELIEKGIKDKLAEIESSNTDFLGVSIKTKAVRGKIHKEIKQFAMSENFDLIVMGTHGISGVGNFEKYVLGSNAYRVVYSAECPVLTVKHATPKVDIKNIVLPLDVSKITTQKVKVAITWAKLLGSTIHAISVSSFLDEYRVDKVDLDYKLEEVVEQIKESQVPVITEVLRNDFITNSVLKYAEDVKADLTMIMTRQESKLNELLMGSQARKMISESKIPVLSLRPQSN